MTKYAVIDLGSNTFHLLIIQVHDPNKFEIIFRKRIFTGLSEGGVDIIKEEKIIKGLDAIRYFRTILTEHHNPSLVVIGTAILRHASNKEIFIRQAEDILKTDITVIDGLTEADYIFKGITLHEEICQGAHLIMDVGGGSTELILINNGQKIWAKSYPLGVGILHERFHKSEPISKTNLHELREYILHTVRELKNVIMPYQPLYLTGASGSFEILQMMSHGYVDDHKLNYIDNDTFFEIYHKIINADATQRLQLKGMPPDRVKLIVVAMALKKVIHDIVQPQNIIVSPYALKEGVLRDMIRKTCSK